MSVEVSVRGHGCTFSLQADRYESPEITTGEDANWLSGRVDLTVDRSGSFSARRDVSPYLPDLTAFRDQLRLLDEELSGEATLTHLEGEFGLTIALERGRGTLSGFVKEHVGATLSFSEIEIDQTFVREALQQLDALVTAFPPR
jgi:hypothetical protein